MSEMIDVKQVVDVSTVHKYWTSGTLVNVRWMWQSFCGVCVRACVSVCMHVEGGTHSVNGRLVTLCVVECMFIKHRPLVRTVIDSSLYDSSLYVVATQ